MTFLETSGLPVLHEGYFYIPLLLGLLALAWLYNRPRARGRRRAYAMSLEAATTTAEREHAEAAEQQRDGIVQRVGFETRPILDRDAYPVLVLLEEVARQTGPGLRAMAHVSLGETLSPVASATRHDRTLAIEAIGGEWLDLGLFDGEGRLVLAVELAGSGRRGVARRVETRRNALARAGVPLVEVPRGFDRETVLGEIRRLLTAG